MTDLVKPLSSRSVLSSVRRTSLTVALYSWLKTRISMFSAAVESGILRNRIVTLNDKATRCSILGCTSDRKKKGLPMKILLLNLAREEYKFVGAQGTHLNVPSPFNKDWISELIKKCGTLLSASVFTDYNMKVFDSHPSEAEIVSSRCWCILIWYRNSSLCLNERYRISRPLKLSVNLRGQFRPKSLHWSSSWRP